MKHNNGLKDTKKLKEANNHTIIYDLPKFQTLVIFHGI